MTLIFNMGTVFGVNNKRDERLDKLKEILLTLALFQVYDENIDKNNRLYQLYDGTMLPSASGYSDLNALSTYISHGGDKSKAINMFYNEEKLYNKEDYNLGTMGHFTQLVWRNTTKLGCAWGWNPYYNKIIIVCRYDPIGNWNTGTAGVLSQNVKNLKEGFTSHIQADNFKNYAAWPWK